MKDLYCERHKCRFVNFCTKCQWGEDDDPRNWTSENAESLARNPKLM